jgi:hypothetical protein
MEMQRMKHRSIYETMTGRRLLLSIGGTKDEVAPAGGAPFPVGWVKIGSAIARGINRDGDPDAGVHHAEQRLHTAGLDHLQRLLNRHIGAGVVLGEHLNLTAKNAIMCIDLVDGELHALPHRRPPDRTIAGHVKQAADLDRLIAEGKGLAQL